MSAAVVALQAALIDLAKERERLGQALAVAQNERNGRAEDITKRLQVLDRETTQIDTLIAQFLEDE